MGLSGPKKRSKLSHDPNNNAWAKSTNFGQKIMAAHGWRPGDYLGASDAAHSTHYTAANASHIRVTLREDNLGLGAKIGGNSAETFGLATLSSIFGRLNGESVEALEKKQSALRDAELRNWQANKSGYMTFVSGGFLVGDDIKSNMNNTGASEGEADKQPQRKKRKTTKESAPHSVEPSSQSRKKRKTESAAELHNVSTESDSSSSEEENAEESNVSEDNATVAAKNSRQKKEKKGTSSTRDEDEPSEKSKKKSSKKQKDKDKSSRPQKSEDGVKPWRRKLIEQRRAKKEEKRARKAEKQGRQAQRDKARRSSKASTQLSKPPPNISSEPDQSTPSTAMASMQFGGNRHAVRHRYIQQKRLASMNPQALKEILMLKAGA